MAFAAMKRSDWARPELERLREADQKNALYVYWLGKLDFEDQQLPRATARFEEAIRMDPGLVKAHDMLGVAKQVAGQYDAAAKSFEEAVRLNRRAASPSAWPPLDYGSLLLDERKLAEAEALLREAVRYEPKLSKAHYKLGTSLELQNKTQEAISELKLSASLDASSPEPWYALARIYRHQGREAEAESAIAEFKKHSRTAK